MAYHSVWVEMILLTEGFVVKRGLRLLLLAAVAVMTCAASQAKDSVSLVGISADRDNGRVVIELHISGPADFQINRFTTGDWVSVWSDSFAISDSISEIPLELDRPDLADLVTGASLVNESRKSAIHLYLGPEANRRGVCITEDGDTVRVYIPEKAEPVEEPSLPVAPAVQPAFEEPLTAALDAVGPAEPAEEAIAPADVDELNGTVGEGAPVDVGSFYVPREGNPVAAVEDGPTGIDDEVSVTPPTIKTKSEPKVEIEFLSPPPVPFKGPEQPEPGIASFETPASAAQMNYQYLRSDSGASSDSGAEDAVGEPPSMEEMMETATKMATEMLGEMYQEAAQAQPDSDGSPRPITTAGGFYDPYQAAALIAQDPAVAPLLRDGKDALADIKIELFEIVSSPLDQAITLLVAPTGYNIIVDSSVGGNNVSLSFKDSQTNLKSALDLLTRTYGLAYSVQANTIVVAGKDQIEGQLVEYETRLFVLSYADPKSIKTILTSTNLLKDNQVEIYAGEEVYPEVNDSTELSTESNSEGTEIKKIESNLSSTPRNAVLVKAVPEQMAVIAKVIEKLDRQPKVIKLEVRVCEASETALEDLGISIQTNDQATATPIVTTWTEVQEALNGGNRLGNEDFSLGSFNRSQLQFIAQLNSQLQEGTVEVLAQPTLSTVEGKQAIYFAGERVPYIAEVSYTQTGTQVSVDFLNVGVTLNFKPRLDNDGRLTIDVNPIVSSLLEFRMIGELMEAPRTSSRQMATTVRVADQEPFVLSGLITETERKTITKVPLLGDLPLVGKIFRNKNLKGERTEIIVVVIPHIMD